MELRSLILRLEETAPRSPGDRRHARYVAGTAACDLCPRVLGAAAQSNGVMGEQVLIAGIDGTYLSAGHRKKVRNQL